jgi:hypothetical protein
VPRPPPLATCSDDGSIDREAMEIIEANPLEHLAHQNQKDCFAKRRKIKQVGMATALLIARVLIRPLRSSGDGAGDGCRWP